MGFGCSLRWDSVSNKKMSITGTFNVGSDLGVSPHQPDLAQGHGIFGEVDLKFNNQKVFYEIGHLVPFSSLAGVKYNKLGFGFSLKNLLVVRQKSYIFTEVTLQKKVGYPFH